MHKYSDSNLRTEIEQYIYDLRDRHEHLHPKWIAQAICQGHRDGLTPDDTDHRAFWEFTGYTTTRKYATECINKYDTGLDDMASLQPMFPGFASEHLQPYYVVARDGADVGIPISDCTDSELLAKAAMFEANARKLTAHANELRRFVEWRQEHLRSAS